MLSLLAVTENGIIFIIHVKCFGVEFLQVILIWFNKIHTLDRGSKYGQLLPPGESR